MSVEASKAAIVGLSDLQRRYHYGNDNGATTNHSSFLERDKVHPAEDKPIKTDSNLINKGEGGSVNYRFDLGWSMATRVHLVFRIPSIKVTDKFRSNSEFDIKICYPPNLGHMIIQSAKFFWGKRKNGQSLSPLSFNYWLNFERPGDERWVQMANYRLGNDEKLTSWGYELPAFDIRVEIPFLFTHDEALALPLLYFRNSEDEPYESYVFKLSLKDFIRFQTTKVDPANNFAPELDADGEPLVKTGFTLQELETSVIKETVLTDGIDHKTSIPTPDRYVYYRELTPEDEEWALTRHRPDPHNPDTIAWDREYFYTDYLETITKNPVEIGKKDDLELPTDYPIRQVFWVAESVSEIKSGNTFCFVNEEKLSPCGPWEIRSNGNVIASGDDIVSGDMNLQTCCNKGPLTKGWHCHPFSFKKEPIDSEFGYQPASLSLTVQLIHQTMSTSRSAPRQHDNFFGKQSKSIDSNDSVSTYNIRAICVVNRSIHFGVDPKTDKISGCEVEGTQSRSIRDKF